MRLQQLLISAAIVVKVESVEDRRKVTALYEQLEARRETLGEDHPDTVTTLNELGSLLKVQGHYEQAKPFYERSLKVLKKAFGDDHPRVATAHHNLAQLLRNQGHYDQAKWHSERSLKILKKSLGEDHPDVASSLSNIGDLMRVQGEYEQARTLYKSSLENNQEGPRRRPSRLRYRAQQLRRVDESSGALRPSEIA